MNKPSPSSAALSAHNAFPLALFLRNDRLFYPSIFFVWVLLLWIAHRDFSYTQPPLSSAPITAYPMQQQQIINKSITELKNALGTEKNPTQLMHINHNLGIEYFDRYKLTTGRAFLDSARIFFEISLRSAPPIARFYYNMGRTYTEYRDHARAKTFYEKALEFEPNHILALHNLALLNYFELHRPADAKAYMLRVLTINSRLPVCNFILGEIAQDEKDFANARDFYERELFLDTTQTALQHQLPIPSSSIAYAVGMAHLRLAVLFSTKFIDQKRAQENLYAYLRLEPDPANRNSAITEMKKYWVLQ